MFKYKYLLNIYNKKKIDKKFFIFYDIRYNNYINNLNVIFRLPSNINYKNKFILMLILLEKYMNNKLIFLLDKRTLSNSKFVKIGYQLSIQKDFLYSFMQFIILYDFKKDESNNLYHYFSKSFDIRYKKNKLLLNLIFNFNNDNNNYYDYLNDFNYDLIILVQTIFTNKYLNFNLLKLNGYFFILSFRKILEINNNNIIYNLVDDIDDNFFFLKNESNNICSLENNEKLFNDMFFSDYIISEEIIEFLYIIEEL